MATGPKSISAISAALCAHIDEALKAASVGDAIARAWLTTTFVGDKFWLEASWTASPPTLEQQLEASQILIDSLLRRLGDAQARSATIGDQLRAERDRDIVLETLARRQQWEVTQQAEQQAAAQRRRQEEKLAQQEASQQAQQRTERVAAEHIERAERNAANIERKRAELAAFMP